MPPSANSGPTTAPEAHSTAALDSLKDRLADPVGDRIVESLRLTRQVGGSDLGRPAGNTGGVPARERPDAQRTAGQAVMDHQCCTAGSSSAVDCPGADGLHSRSCGGLQHAGRGCCPCRRHGYLGGLLPADAPHRGTACRENGSCGERRLACGRADGSGLGTGLVAGRCAPAFPPPAVLCRPDRTAAAFRYAGVPASCSPRT